MAVLGQSRSGAPPDQILDPPLRAHNGRFWHSLVKFHLSDVSLRITYSYMKRQPRKIPHIAR